MKKRINRSTIPLLLFSCMVFSSYCQAKVTPMTEEQLKAETGKGFSASVTPNGTISFTIDEQTKGGIPILANGTLEVMKQGAQDITQNALTLSDAAQQNLQALINVNANNSQVQVLANINVAINSTIGSIEQFNQAVSNRVLSPQ